MRSSNVFPTKGNLLNLKKSLGLSKKGHSLLDKKRQVLFKEAVRLADCVGAVKDEIDESFKAAYFALARVNMALGGQKCFELAESTRFGGKIKTSYASLMGVRLVCVELEQESPEMQYCFGSTSCELDSMVLAFNELKQKLAKLAELESNIYRLSLAIKKTQERTNALKNLVIPGLEEDLKYVLNTLEEREREEFSYLKAIKQKKGAIKEDGVLQ